MKEYYFSYPDCEHSGDIETAKGIVLDAISAVGCEGVITGVRWSGEDGDNAYVFFKVPPQHMEAVFRKIDENL